jgi:hypothetical protein
MCEGGFVGEGGGAKGESRGVFSLYVKKGPGLCF